MAHSLGADGIVIDGPQLTEFSARIFSAAGMPQDYANIQADILVWANLRGIDSHGVLRIPWYIDRIDAGDMIPDAKPVVVSETAATVLIEAGGAPGPVGTMAGVEAAIAKASATGIGWAVVRNLTHNGALAYYTSRIAARNFIGMTTVSSPPNMAPFGARAPGLHNSPISIGIPSRKYPPVILDMATSVAAGGKIYFAADRSLPIPEGWALDADGNSTTDPKRAKIWLPFEGPKGSGLAMMFECWSSLLADNPLSTPHINGQKGPEEDLRQNAMIAVVDVAAFLPAQVYKQHVDELVDGIKGLPRMGKEEIMVPGEKEEVTYLERERDGIVLPRGTIDRIKVVADRFSIPVPW